MDVLRGPEINVHAEEPGPSPALSPGSVRHALPANRVLQPGLEIVGRASGCDCWPPGESAPIRRKPGIEGSPGSTARRPPLPLLPPGSAAGTAAAERLRVWKPKRQRDPENQLAWNSCSNESQIEAPVSGPPKVTLENNNRLATNQATNHLVPGRLADTVAGNNSAWISISPPTPPLGKKGFRYTRAE